MDTDDHAGRALRPRLRAGRAAGRPQQDARHAPGERAVPPRGGHPLPVRPRREARARLDGSRSWWTSRPPCWPWAACRPRATCRAACSRRRSTQGPGPPVASYETGAPARPRPRRTPRPTRRSSSGSEPGLHRRRAAGGPARRRATSAHALAAGRAQHRRAALRGRAATRRRPSPTRSCSREDPDDAIAAHEPGRRPGRPGPLRRGDEAAGRGHQARAAQRRGVPQPRRRSTSGRARRSRPSSEYRTRRALQPAVRAVAAGARAPHRHRRRATRRAPTRRRSAVAPRRAGQPGRAPRQLRGGHAGCSTEAEKIAPRYALVHQYRSNVAYLMGDTRRRHPRAREGAGARARTTRSSART